MGHREVLPSARSLGVVLGMLNAACRGRGAPAQQVPEMEDINSAGRPDQPGVGAERCGRNPAAKEVRSGRLIACRISFEAWQGQETVDQGNKRLAIVVALYQ